MYLQVNAENISDCDYRAHLLAECGDISASFSTGLKGDVSGIVHLWRLEAVEHLPAAPSEMATSAVRLQEVHVGQKMKRGHVRQASNTLAILAWHRVPCNLEPHPSASICSHAVIVSDSTPRVFSFKVKVLSAAPFPFKATFHHAGYKVAGSQA